MNPTKLHTRSTTGVDRSSDSGTDDPDSTLAWVKYLNCFREFEHVNRMRLYARRYHRRC